MTNTPPPKTVFKADALNRIQHIFVKNLDLMVVIGVYDHEKVRSQRVVANLDLTVKEAGEVADNLEHVVCYHEVVKKIQQICAKGHVNLLETLAERIAKSCLEDKRIIAVRIRLEKPGALREAESVGVEIERLQTNTQT